MLYKSSLNRSYSANPQDVYIPQKPENLRVDLIIIFYFYFALLIDIIDNIIHKSVLWHNNSSRDTD